LGRPQSTHRAVSVAEIAPKPVETVVVYAEVDDIGKPHRLRVYEHDRSTDFQPAPADTRYPPEI
jgi:hypothetical protein